MARNSGNSAPITAYSRSFTTRSTREPRRIVARPEQGLDDAARFAREVEPPDVLRTTNTLLLRDAAIAGLGVSVLPDWLVTDAIAEGRLVGLLDDLEVTLSTFDASVWLAFPSRRYVPERVRVVTDFLAQRLSGEDSG